MALWEKPEVAVNQAHCSVDERHGQSALGDLPRENDGLEGNSPHPHSANHKPSGSIPPGINARTEEVETSA